MKTIPLVLLLLTPCVWAEERACDEKDWVPTGRPGESMRQGLAQEYLSGAVYMAMMRQDVEMLKRLRAYGWDPHKPLIGDMWSAGKLPLHEAVLLNSVKSIEWLLNDQGVKKDLRNDEGEVALGIIIWGEEHDKRQEEEVEVSDITKPIIDLLKRDDDGGLDGLYEEILIDMTEGFNKERRIYVMDASKTPNPKKFFDAFHQRCPQSVTLDHAKKVDEMDTRGKVITYVTVALTKVDDKNYKYAIDYNSGPLSGGGTNGRVVSRYGYWIMINEGGYDS